MNTATQNKPNTIESANELRNMASKWVQEFNFIRKDILDMVAEREGSYLGEFIRQDELTWNDLAEYTGQDVKTLKKSSKILEQHAEYEHMREDKEQNNYPMWNTCFEFKSNESEDIIQAAINAGCGVIEGLGDFNTILFFKGCGYSFYGAHWIPLFLELPWNKAIKEQYKGVKFDMV